MALMGSGGLVLASSGWLLSCSSDDGRQSVEARYLVATDFIVSWNSYLDFSQGGLNMRHNLCDRLIELNEAGALAPGLAEEWKQINDRTWEFRLRNDVKFHDGQAFGPDDVKASIELGTGFTEEEHGAAMAAFWTPQRVEIVDDRTVRLVGERPFGPLINMLTAFPILCAEDIKKGSDALDDRVNGTGPYRLEGNEAERKTLKAFNDYFDGRPEIDTMVFELVTDQQTRLNALFANQATLTQDVDPQQADSVRERGNTNLAVAEGTIINGLFIRMDKEPFGSNQSLRKALAWGIDREAIATGVVGGQTKVANSHIPPAALFHVPQEPVYQYDPERARAELEASGVDLPVPFEIFTSRDVTLRAQESVQLMAQNLNEVGFDVKLNIVEGGAFAEVLFGEGKQGDAIYARLGILVRDPSFNVAVHYDPANASPFGPSDARSAELIESGRTTVDQKQREQIYAELQAHLWDYLPMIPTVITPINMGFDADLQGMELIPTGYTWLRNASLSS
jgi:peptide/nickel transport system substrate-binding protein